VIRCQNADNATFNRQPDHTRPETHQNLIHPDKEQNRRQTTKSSIERRSPDDVVLAEEQQRHDLMTFPRVTGG
jgi:hypothetical protein